MMKIVSASAFAAVMFASGPVAALPVKDTPTPANPGKVQVYILLGQSNMLGEGAINGDKNGTLEFAVDTEKKYSYLGTSTNWATRDDARYAFVMGNSNNTLAKSPILHNEWMSVVGSKIGPELGIGNRVADYSKEPVLFLKSCIGDRSLGWDLLPPGSPEEDYTDKNNVTYTYAGYGESPPRWVKGQPKGKPINWQAGIQYDGDTKRAQTMLDDIGTYYPGATDYEVAGFFWWQGNKDHFDDGDSAHYERNLVRLIKTLRKDFNSPDALFVTASLGETVKGSTDNGGIILDAMLDVDGTSGKYPEFKDNVAAVYAHPYSMGSSSSAHYGGNAETYMNIGQAMGDAMVKLLQIGSK